MQLCLDLAAPLSSYRHGISENDLTESTSGHPEQLYFFFWNIDSSESRTIMLYSSQASLHLRSDLIFSHWLHECLE